MNTAESTVSSEEIARRAYEIWESRGCPPGDGSEDWQAAERELISTRISRRDATPAGIWNWWCRVREKISGRELQS